ncbi:MAG: DUF4921 family protein [Acidimicrobiia bacterium]
MPELRVDALSGRWVLVAADRAARPYTLGATPTPAAGTPENCPFCPGHEAMTPPEVHRTGTGAPDTPGWRVRVVPNLYPAVGGEHAGEGATGAHEVIVLSPSHQRSWGQLDDAEATEALTVLRDRTRTHLAGGRTFVQPIVNHGRAAGASIEHPHAQLVALDVVPPLVRARIERFADGGEDLVTAELARAMRADLTVVTGAAVAWCPPAASSPYEMRVAHRSTRARFDEATDVEVGVVAVAVRDALARLLAAAGDVPYNLVVHSAPPGPARFFHWFVEVQPRLTVVAGFELGTGIFVNTVPPEHAANALRTTTP